MSVNNGLVPDFAQPHLISGDTPPNVQAAGSLTTIYRDGEYLPPGDNMIHLAHAAGSRPISGKLYPLSLSIAVPLCRAERLLYCRVARTMESGKLASVASVGELRFFIGANQIGKLPMDFSGRSSVVQAGDDTVRADYVDDYPVNYSVAMFNSNANQISSNANLYGVTQNENVIEVLCRSKNNTLNTVFVPPMLKLLLVCDRIEFFINGVESVGTNSGNEVFLFFLACLTRTPINVSLAK